MNINNNLLYNRVDMKDNIMYINQITKRCVFLFNEQSIRYNIGSINIKMQ